MSAQGNTSLLLLHATKVFLLEPSVTQCQQLLVGATFAEAQPSTPAQENVIEYHADIVHR